MLYYFYLINGEITDETGFYSGEGCWGALLPIITASVGLNTYCKVIPLQWQIPIFSAISDKQLLLTVENFQIRFFTKMSSENDV